MLKNVDTVAYRARLLGQAGADGVWVLPFTTELSQLTPEEFVERMLVARLHPVAVVVGSDFRFGHRAAGDVATLASLGEQYGFTVEPVAVTGREDGWSSTELRARNRMIAAITWSVSAVTWVRMNPPKLTSVRLT